MILYWILIGKDSSEVEVFLLLVELRSFAVVCVRYRVGFWK